MHGHANAVWALRQPWQTVQAGRDGARLDRLTGESGRRAVQWMNESLAKGANGQQSCWHTDHTQPHTHTRLHVATHTYSATHTHGTLTRAQRLQFRVARLDLALLWCFAAYFMACWAHCVFASCPLPVTDLFAFPFVCLPSSPPLSCTLSFSPVHVSHTAVFQFAQKTRMSIAASSISMWLWDWFLACRLSDSLTVWLLVCFSSSPPFSALLHIFAFPSLGSMHLRHKQLTTVPPTGWGFD